MHLMLHAVKVVPIRRHERSELLEVDAVRGVAYRAVCRCGWRGRGAGRHHDARAEGLEHVAAHRRAAQP